VAVLASTAAPTSSSSAMTPTSNPVVLPISSSGAVTPTSNPAVRRPRPQIQRCSGLIFIRHGDLDLLSSGASVSSLLVPAAGGAVVAVWLLRPDQRQWGTWQPDPAAAAAGSMGSDGFGSDGDR
jgi:hypothetical protein